MNEDTEKILIKVHYSEILESSNNLHIFIEDLRKQLKEVYSAGFEEGCKAASQVRCKDCRSFAEVTPNSYQKSIRVCIKGHNGYETFGCTEGEPRNDTTDK